MNSLSPNSTRLPYADALEPSVAMRAWTYGWAISRHTQEPIECVFPLLSSKWHAHEPEFLMSTNLISCSVQATAGYSLHTEKVGSLAFARLVADTGELAASGQAAIDGSIATFDKIVTAASVLQSAN